MRDSRGSIRQGFGATSTLNTVVRQPQSPPKRRYPALAPAVTDGRCQRRGCSEAASYRRVWLDTTSLGHIHTASINGVRYCEPHALDLWSAEGIPVLLNPEAQLRYHRRVIAIERHYSAGGATTSAPPAPVANLDSGLLVRVSPGVPVKVGHVKSGNKP